MILGTTQLACLALSLALSAKLEERPVKVTVLIVLATGKNHEVNAKLKPLAEAVKNREPSLTGFKLHQTLDTSIRDRESGVLELVEQQVLRVKIEQPRNAAGRVKLTIRPPGMGDITYECVCGKYLPVVTPYVTKNGDRLILAIMASPCLGK
jgi:hypothetical protein